MKTLTIVDKEIYSEAFLPLPLKLSASNEFTAPDGIEDTKTMSINNCWFEIKNDPNTIVTNGKKNSFITTKNKLSLSIAILPNARLPIMIPLIIIEIGAVKEPNKETVDPKAVGSVIWPINKRKPKMAAKIAGFLIDFLKDTRTIPVKTDSPKEKSKIFPTVLNATKMSKPSFPINWFTTGIPIKRILENV